MVTFVSNIESSDGRKEFDSYEQLDEFLSGFGSTRFNGQKVQFLVRENEYDSLRKLADLDEDIVVVTKPSNISILRNFIDQKHFNPSKYDLIMDLQMKCDKIAEEMVSMPLEADRTVITTQWSVLHDLLEELRNS